MTTSISLFGVSHIDLKILCDNCGCEFMTDSFYVPEPDFTADRSRESSVMESEDFHCNECEKEFNLTIYNSFAGADIEEDHLLMVIPHYSIEHDDFIDREVEAVLAEKEFYASFNVGISKLDRIVGIETSLDLQEILIQKSYAGLVTQLETYLHATFIKKILTNKTHYRDFVEKFLDFKNESFKLNEIFLANDKLENKVKKALSELMYHNLPKIKPLAKTVFNVEMPVLPELMKIINIRHDIVHRNGKDKDGNVLVLSIDDYFEARDKVSTFINSLEEEFNGF